MYRYQLIETCSAVRILEHADGLMVRRSDTFRCMCLVQRMNKDVLKLNQLSTTQNLGLLKPAIYD